MQKLIKLLVGWAILATSLSAAPLSGGEWFIDLDPGEGQGTAIAGISGNALSGDITIDPSTIDALSDGAHLLGLRFQDDTGAWGQVTWRLFLVAHPGGALGAGEYFFNTDPGEGAATALEGINGTTIIQVPEVALTGLPAGANLIGIRFQNSEGAWGQTSYRIFLNPEPEAQELARIEFSLFEGETLLTSGSLLGDGSLVIDLAQVELEAPLNEGENLVLQLQAIDTQGKAGHKFAKKISIKNFTQDFLDLFFTPAEQTNPSLSGPLADADLDGITNLLEQASGLNPRVANKQSDAVTIGAATSTSKTFRFRAASETIFNAPESTFSLGSLRFEIEVSEDAESWSKANSPADFTIAPESSANDDGSFSHVLNLTDGGQSKRFHRLRVIQE